MIPFGNRLSVGVVLDLTLLSSLLSVLSVPSSSLTKNRSKICGYQMGGCENTQTSNDYG